jgi:protein-S-isoprenylcysteine O-methyltransferase Ste14
MPILSLPAERTASKTSKTLPSHPSISLDVNLFLGTNRSPLGYTGFNHAWVYRKIETMTHGMLIVDYLWGVFFLLLICAALRTKKTQRRENVASRLSYTVITALGLALMFWVNVGVSAMNVRWLPQFDAAEIAGIAIIIAGLAFAVWARWHLKSNWSGVITVKQDHQLIRSGPYRWVRHPIYSGVILAMAGTAFVNGRLTGILGVLLIFIGFWIKSRKEEQFMRQTFGEQYEVYCQSTGALIPRL